MMAPPRRCQSIKCPYPRAGTDVRMQKLRARRSPLEGGGSPRARRSSLEGGANPRARRSPLEGALDWATPMGRGGRHGVGCPLGACLSDKRFTLVFCRF
jgi:hypothetical protein